MSTQVLSTVLAAIVTIVIGWSVLLRDRRQRQYVSFAVFCFVLGLWYLLHFLATTIGSLGLGWVSYLFAAAIPITAERFFRSFLAKDPRRPVTLSRTVIIATALVYLGLLVAVFFPLRHSRYYGIPLLLFVIGGLYYCLYLIFLRQREAKSKPEATRLTYLLVGGLASVTLSATDYLYELDFAFPIMGRVLTVIYLYFFSQTLFHYRLLDIKELLGRMVELSIRLLILTAIYGLVVVWVDTQRHGVFFFNTIVASFIILVLFDPLHRGVESHVNRWLFREKFEFSQRLKGLTADLANIIEVSPLVRRILQELEASARVTHASIYLADAAGLRMALAGHVGPPPEERLDIAKRSLFFQRLPHAGMLSLEALERDLTDQISQGRANQGQDEAAVATRNIIATMKELSAGVCIPLFADDQLVGLFNLQDDRLREAYSSGELEQLRALASQVAITLRNSRVYEEMKERDRLAALGQMAAGLAHEIRNPLGAIKGAAQLLNTRPQALLPAASEGPNSEEENEEENEEEEYVGIIVEEVNRLDRVVSQFLGYARPYRGEYLPLDVNDVIRKSIQLLQQHAAETEILSALAPDLPQVRANAEQLHQVFLNLGLNGIQASKARGQLRIETQTRQAEGHTQSFVEIRFIDDGAGITPEMRSNIFIPFFTTKDGGTGLGLPICQRIVENHGGIIEVSSEPGQGAVFSVVIPAQGAKTTQTAT
jgi:two-component system, NtrC family, sensor histidine kinase HydH